MNNENLIAIRTRGNFEAISRKPGVIDLRMPRRFCGIREKVIAVEAIEERELTGIARRESFPKFCPEKASS